MAFVGKISFRDPATFMKRLGPRGLRFATTAHTAMARNLVAEIKRTAPKKSGKYANSWYAGTSNSRRVEARTKMPRMFDLLEFTGRSPGPIDPVRAKVLRFEQHGQIRFAAHVDHPGFPPIPHVRPALRRIERSYPRELKRAMRFGWRQ